MISAEASLVNVGDSEVLPTIAEPISQKRSMQYQVMALMTLKCAIKLCGIDGVCPLSHQEKMLVTEKKDTLEMKPLMRSKTIC